MSQFVDFISSLKSDRALLTEFLSHPVISENNYRLKNIILTNESIIDIISLYKRLQNIIEKSFIESNLTFERKFRKIIQTRVSKNPLNQEKMLSRENISDLRSVHSGCTDPKCYDKEDPCSDEQECTDIDCGNAIVNCTDTSSCSDTENCVNVAQCTNIDCNDTGCVNGSGFQGDNCVDGSDCQDQPSCTNIGSSCIDNSDCSDNDCTNSGCVDNDNCVDNGCKNDENCVDNENCVDSYECSNITGCS